MRDERPAQTEGGILIMIPGLKIFPPFLFDTCWGACTLQFFGTCSAINVYRGPSVFGAAGSRLVSVDELEVFAWTNPTSEAAVHNLPSYMSTLSDTEHFLQSHATSLTHLDEVHLAARSAVVVIHRCTHSLLRLRHSYCHCGVPMAVPIGSSAE